MENAQVQQPQGVVGSLLGGMSRVHNPMQLTCFGFVCLIAGAGSMRYLFPNDTRVAITAGLIGGVVIIYGLALNFLKYIRPQDRAKILMTLIVACLVLMLAFGGMTLMQAKDLSILKGRAADAAAAIDEPVKIVPYSGTSSPDKPAEPSPKPAGTPADHSDVGNVSPRRSLVSAVFDGCLSLLEGRAYALEAVDSSSPTASAAGPSLLSTAGDLSADSTSATAGPGQDEPTLFAIDQKKIVGILRKADLRGLPELESRKNALISEFERARTAPGLDKDTVLVPEKTIDEFYSLRNDIRQEAVNRGVNVSQQSPRQSMGK